MAELQKKTMLAMQAAFDARDGKKVAELYTADAKIVNPSREGMKEATGGRDGIRKGHEELFSKVEPKSSRVRTLQTGDLVVSEWIGTGKENLDTDIVPVGPRSDTPVGPADEGFWMSPQNLPLSKCFSNCGQYKFQGDQLGACPKGYRCPGEPPLDCVADPASNPLCYYWKAFCCAVRRTIRETSTRARARTIRSACRVQVVGTCAESARASPTTKRRTAPSTCPRTRTRRRRPTSRRSALAAR